MKRIKIPYGSFGRHLVAFLAVIAATLLVSHRANALTSNDIINMSNIGVADSVIISAISVSGEVFHLTDDEVQRLIRAGVSQSVVDAMRSTEKPAQPVESPASPAGSTAAPLLPAASGAPEKAMADPVSEPTRSSVPPPAASDSAPPPTRTAPAPSLPSRTNAAVAPLPTDVKELKRKYDTGKYTSVAVAGFELLTGTNKDRYEASRSTIYYYLAKSLFKLQYYHSAHDIFLKVAEDGPTGPHFNGCLSNLIRTSEILHDYRGLTSVLRGVSSMDLPRTVRSKLMYVIGSGHYEERNYDSARRALEAVPTDSELYAQAQFLSAMAMHLQGDDQLAVATFRALIRAQVVGDYQRIKDIKELSLLNMARIYYRVEDFGRAELLYERVPHDSRYWHQALFEAAYTNFWQGDYNVGLGQILTLESPFFKDQIHLPDVGILKSLMFFNLCEYELVQRIIKEYKATNTPRRDELRAVLAAYRDITKLKPTQFHENSDQMRRATSIYAVFFENAQPSDTGLESVRKLPRDMRKTVEGTQNLSDVLHHIQAVKRERQNIATGKTRWKGTVLGNSLNQKLKEDELKLKADAGYLVLSHLDKLEKDLTQLLGQADIILFEVVNAQKEEAEDKFRNPEYVETYEELQKQYATAAEFIYWPFNGEFWQDELGYYRFTERGACVTRK